MNNKPTHYLYNVTDNGGGNDAEDKGGIWTRIGAAWPHGDGKGFNISLDLPMVLSHQTRLVLRLREEQEEEAADEAEMEVA